MKNSETVQRHSHKGDCHTHCPSCAKMPQKAQGIKPLAPELQKITAF